MPDNANELLIGYLRKAVDDGASDIFIVAGAVPSVKLDGQLVPIGESFMLPPQTEELIREIYVLAKRDITNLMDDGDDDFSFAVPGLARFRVNTFKQRGSLASVIRIVSFNIPDWRERGIPEEVMKLATHRSGMVLVTGVAGSGKSTTEACILNEINETRSCHIITLEDPIEFLYKNKKSVICQREIAIDTIDYIAALRACLRQAPDVIQLGEMRDQETIKTAMTAAETGHQIFATLHTKGAVNTIDRIMDTFPSDQQDQIRIQLASVLDTVVSQQLLPSVSGGLVPAFEIMHVNSAIKSLIRDAKNHQIENVIASSSSEGMITMDQSIVALCKSGKITRDIALAFASNREQMERKL